MVEILEKLTGQFGVTTDYAFNEITTILDKAGIVVEDNEVFTPEYAWAELVTTKYLVGSKLYELWYQVRTPFSPDDMTCSFGFDEADTDK